SAASPPTRDFGSAAVLRQNFARVLATTPTAYRAKFACADESAAWPAQSSARDQCAGVGRVVWRTSSPEWPTAARQYSSDCVG
ncbi:MAG: hypothetical protein V4703_08275, partial [Actinomycetota bacterium]